MLQPQPASNDRRMGEFHRNEEPNNPFWPGRYKTGGLTEFSRGEKIKPLAE
jgi:hypothetical protein